MCTIICIGELVLTLKTFCQTILCFLCWNHFTLKNGGNSFYHSIEILHKMFNELPKDKINSTLFIGQYGQKHMNYRFSICVILKFNSLHSDISNTLNCESFRNEICFLQMRPKHTIFLQKKSEVFLETQSKKIEAAKN